MCTIIQLMMSWTQEVHNEQFVNLPNTRLLIFKALRSITFVLINLFAVWKVIILINFRFWVKRGH